MSLSSVTLKSPPPRGKTTPYHPHVLCTSGKTTPYHPHVLCTINDLSPFILYKQIMLENFKVQLVYTVQRSLFSFPVITLCPCFHLPRWSKPCQFIQGLENMPTSDSHKVRGFLRTSALHVQGRCLPNSSTLYPHHNHPLESRFINTQQFMLIYRN